MYENLAQDAINLALNGEWEKAIKINNTIIKDNSSDIDALNRLARAYSEIGNIEKARKVAKKVIKIDPFNSIAKKALEKWKDLKKGETYKSPPTVASNFLEEPGRTKIVPLLHSGDCKVLAKLDSGDEVILNTHSHRICICTKDGKYIGKLPDDLSARLKKLIRLGNIYQVLIKSIDAKEAKVFIRETTRAKALSDIPSFPSEKIEYVSFTPPELVHKKEERNQAEEEEE